MKRILPLLALVAVGIVVVVLLRGRETGKEPSAGPIQFKALIDEALAPVNPEAKGVAWPEDDQLKSVRAEWHKLGFRDSTLAEELNRDWYYPAGRAPLRLTNLAQTPTGRGLTLRERLEFGEKLAKNPKWQMGSARFFPALSVVLSSHEKLLASSLMSREEPQTLNRLARDLDLSEPAVQSLLDEFAALGWVTVVGADSAVTYTMDRIDLRGTGALQFLTLVPQSGLARDVVSFRGLMDRMPESLTTGTVTLYGPCAQTGKIVEMTLRDGQMRRGKPGKAWAASILPPGQSNGLFASEDALNAWIAAHPDAKVESKGTVVEAYQNMLAAKE